MNEDAFWLKRSKDRNLTLLDVRRDLLRDVDVNLELLSRYYKRWLEEPVYLMFHKEEDPNKKYYFLAPKRGNQVYGELLSKKVREKLNFMDSPGFKPYVLRRNNGRDGLTNCLFITLTWDAKLFRTPNGKTMRLLGEAPRLNAWANIPYFYNLFITKLRQRYGKVWVLRTLEATEKGYPHIHLLVITETPFNAFPLYSKKERKVIWRIREVDDIKEFWGSFVDVRVPVNVKAVRKYVFKDMMKCVYRLDKTPRDFLSLSLMWLFRKQGYAISGKKVFSDLIPKGIIQIGMDDFKAHAEDKAGGKLIYDGICFVMFRHLTNPPPYFECAHTYLEELCYA